MQQYPFVKENLDLFGEIGSGGTAKVYIAHDKWANKTVAVKALFKSSYKDNYIRNKFKQEANQYLYLDHPNIVNLTDYIEKDDTDYIVMEFIDGKTLDEYINTVSGPLVGENLINIFSQILAGVAHAHHDEIFHLDIKPSNIMITNDMKVKVLDFGISSTKEEKIEKEKRRMGTPMYMSPEQVTMSEIQRFSDIYSLGVTLFYAVTATLPYKGKHTFDEIFHKIKYEALPEINQFYPYASPKLQKVINKATAKKIEDRFQSCEEFDFFLQESLKT